jgi:5,10-methylenetetrahydrofolate reductase
MRKSRKAKELYNFILMVAKMRTFQVNFVNSPEGHPDLKANVEKYKKKWEEEVDKYITDYIRRNP